MASTSVQGNQARPRVQSTKVTPVMTSAGSLRVRIYPNPLANSSSYHPPNANGVCRARLLHLESCSDVRPRTFPTPLLPHLSR